MYFHDGRIIYSPSDLTRFMESPFASWMDRLYLECPDCVTPDERDDELQLYADAGITHEAKFVQQLEKDGQDLCWVQGDNRDAVAAMTRNAISEGREIIFQAYLSLPPFAGYADFLARVSTDPTRYRKDIHCVADDFIAGSARKNGRSHLQQSQRDSQRIFCMCATDAT